jgi:signal transduction histidine kinase
MLVQDVISTMKPQAEKYNAIINFNASGTGFTVHADKLHFSSVIYNLLDNALKYSRENPVIEVRLLSQQENTIELKVSDNGIGIAPEYRNKIFDKFFRVPSGDKHNVKGYGLGLSYVAEVVKRHHGFIDVESSPGNGSTFIVKVPAQDANNIVLDERRSITREKEL